VTATGLPQKKKTSDRKSEILGQLEGAPENSSSNEPRPKAHPKQKGLAKGK